MIIENTSKRQTRGLSKLKPPQVNIPLFKKVAGITGTLRDKNPEEIRESDSKG